MSAVDALDRALLERLAGRTVGLLETEYPNGLRLQLTAPPTEPITPRSIYPAFYGCYDWHSSVHSHWQVVRALRLLPGASFESSARAVLGRTLTPVNIATELAWVATRPGFEMPYGMAWLLRLCSELRDWDDEQGRAWCDSLAPLGVHAVDRFEQYCSTMVLPVRGGMHNQTAFSLGLVWDSVGGVAPFVRETIARATRRFFDRDTDVDLQFEPSAADFLSPSLSEADLMRRVVPSGEFATWLERFAPSGFDLLRPVEVVDPSDGQLAHWVGLNLSRSWMMTALAHALPAGHRFVPGLLDGAADHAEAGLAMADHDDYMISHWVPSFAVYLLSSAG
ncbi:MAG: DUF2891 domain-containing protein [Ilumatobacteraceae bacterium]